ncbi:carbohydrate binding domain-containing protein [Hyalangium rubrum]|uniref:Carbohydrate binding domain-containing protein n=1 Tax=Hyalangium rubrum TaxID=3103134 RepID=A0ABU5H229_9BACT|nr:carbohydrate binding domain-containing protein [Hyalangium sp. s54d21]MDY7226842.1 carbohydrate binding domain-containing protein [Hyalangium sp. s54d21]
MRAGNALRKPWWLGVLALGLHPGCGGSDPPSIGPNLVQNGSFESGLSGWWNATDAKEGTASASGEAADFGTFGLVLYKGTGGWGSMVGQETTPHRAGQTFQVQARLKGTVGGERVTFSFHGQGFEVVAEPRWRTVKQLLLLPDSSENVTALVSVTSDNTTVHLDEVSFALAEVARGDADKEEDNLLGNGSFESGLGLWNFWTDASVKEDAGTATTSPDAGRSGYAGLVLSKGPTGGGVSVKQPLPDPLAEREAYRVEADIRGTLGSEGVNLCLQINREPWSGPCIFVTATTDWQHVSETLSIDPELIDERVGLMVSLSSEGTAMVDDVIVKRTKAR